MIPEGPPVNKVTIRLRDIWNDPAFQAALLSRTQQRVDVAEGLAPPEAGQDPGTMSHVYDFVNNDAHELLGTFHATENRMERLEQAACTIPSSFWLMVSHTLIRDPR